MGRKREIVLSDDPDVVYTWKPTFRKTPWLLADLPPGEGVDWTLQFDGTSRKPGWSRVALRPENRQSARLKWFRVFYVDRSVLGFTAAGWALAEPLLAPWGEVLPVLYGAKVMYVYNCTVVYRAVERELSELMIYTDGGWGPIREGNHCVFIRGRLGPSPIFRDAIEPSALFFRPPLVHALHAIGLTEELHFFEVGEIIDSTRCTPRGPRQTD